MDIKTWQTMLERRGYRHVFVEKRGTQIVYSIEGVQGVRGAANFETLTYRKIRREIENQLGHGMEYVQHRCGLPLLRARAGYTRDDSFCRVQAPLFHSEYYSVPLRPQPLPLTSCPQCGDRLSQGSVHKITDPEEEQQSRKLEPQFHVGLATG